MRTLEQIKKDLARLAPTDNKAMLLLNWWVKLDNHGAHSDVIITSFLSTRTHQGMVEVAINKEIMQLELDKAREIHRILGSAIEAAISDEILWRFMTEKVGTTDDQAATALLDFRELRQGSRDVVLPS